MKTFIQIAILGACSAQSFNRAAAGIDTAHTAFLRTAGQERGSR